MIPKVTQTVAIIVLLLFKVAQIVVKYLGYFY